MRCVQGLAFAVVMAAVMMAGFTRYVRFFDFKDIVRLDGQVRGTGGAHGRCCLRPVWVWRGLPVAPPF